MSIRTLNEFFDAVNRYVDSVLVIRNGYIVFEQNSSNFVIDSKHHLFSATKSVLSMLIGIAIDKGYIEGVDQRVLDFFPDRTILNLDERKEALTLKHLLTMSSGFDCPDLGNETVGQLMGSWDWDQFALDLPMSGNPGDSYQYCNANTHLLSTILTKATGMSALDFAHEHLFGPLGITDVRWDSDHSDRGRSIGFTGLWMSPQDLAKLGLLYLEGGVWEDEQIVSSSWVAESTQPHTACDKYGFRNGYGYQWWIGSASDGWYMTSGAQGQHLFVLPQYRTMRGSWSSDDTFVMEQIDLDWGEAWELILTFQDDEVSFVFQSQPGTFPFHFETRGRLLE